MRFPETLVLGATGRIGRLLQQVWPQMGLSAKVLWQGRRPQRDQGLNWDIFDPLIASEALAQAATGRGEILCLAGVVPGRGGDLADNAHLAEAAIRTAAKTGARVLLASSAAVYGNQSGILSEALALDPVSDYGRAKVEMERCAINLAADMGVSVCTLRIGNIAGLDAILGGWRPGFQLDRFADGRTPARSYIGVLDLARVLADLVAAPTRPAALNVAQPGAIEMGALLTAAGLPWGARAAAAAAIPQVILKTEQLQNLLPRPLPTAEPAQLAAQWAMLEPHMAENQRTV